MADYTVGFAKHATLTANAVDKVVLRANTANDVEVFNRGATGYIYFTKDGSAPALGADDTYIVAPMTSVTVRSVGTPDDIRLICGTANPYSVTGGE